MLPRTRQEFCAALKAARERRGVTLTDIAEATKICPSHLAALERGDLGHWPKGLYRRTFFRGYVSMIGLPVTEMLDEFVRLFPENDAAPTPAVARVPAVNAPRLSLDVSWHGPKTPFRDRVTAATIDAGVVLVLSIAAWLSTTASVTTSVSIVAVCYFTLATMMLGGSAAAWAMRWHRRRGAIPREPAQEAVVEEGSVLANGWKRSAEVITLLLAPSEDDGGEREERSWISDARRIRPRDIPPRLRVRFKWSP